jgi:hypothetical protein
MATPRLRPAFTSLTASARRNVLTRGFRSTRANRQPDAKTTPRATSTADRIAARLPPRLAHYASRVRAQPASSLAAFLFLHEVTAIAPLVVFYLALGYVTLSPGLVGWIESRSEATPPAGDVDGQDGKGELPRPARILRGLGVYAEERDGGRTGASPVVRAVAAYLVTKVLLPVRLWLSLRWAPGLARWAKTTIGLGR